MQNANLNQLHVAPPKAMQHATLNTNHATTDATNHAKPSLKALAQQVLARNQRCNKHATELKKTCNFRDENATQQLQGATDSFVLSYTKMKAVCGEDWLEVSNNPRLFSAVLDALRTQAMIQSGLIPSHYTKQVNCSHCGIVKLWEDCPDQVLGCPWCLLKTENLQEERQ